MKVEFREMCPSTMTSGRENLYGKINISNDNGNHTFDANCCYPISFRYVYPKRYSVCIDFIGGFVDSAFFVKSEINKLSSEQLEEFTQHISKASEIWEGKFYK